MITLVIVDDPPVVREAPHELLDGAEDISRAERRSSIRATDIVIYLTYARAALAYVR